MCLALGEDPKLLLRGTKLEEFIKYGEREAHVRVADSLLFSECRCCYVGSGVISSLRFESDIRERNTP